MSYHGKKSVLAKAYFRESEMTFWNFNTIIFNHDILYQLSYESLKKRTQSHQSSEKMLIKRKKYMHCS